MLEIVRREADRTSVVWQVLSRSRCTLLLDRPASVVWESKASG